MPYSALVLLLAVAAAGRPLAQSRPSLRASEASEVVLVPVPVLEVVVVDGGRPPQDASEQAAEPARPPQDVSEKEAEPAQPPQAGAVSAKCMSEMTKFASDEKLREKSTACEQKSGHAKAAFQKLQQGEAEAAQAEIQEVFQVCGKISEECAKQLAPDTVLKMRLAGITVTEKCLHAGAALQDKGMTESQMKCQKKSTEAMVRDLQKRDLGGALGEAEQGLKECHGMKTPCDFQLAPSLVMELLKQAGAAEAEPPMETMRVLLAQLPGKAPKRALGSPGEMDTTSLLSIAAHMRLSSRPTRLRL